MAGAAQAVNQGQVPEGARTANVLVEHGHPQALHTLFQPHGNRIADPGAVGFDADVGGAVAHQGHQGQHCAASDESDDDKVPLPAERLDEITGDGGKYAGADTSGGPQDADAQPQAAPEPAADGGHQRHHAQRLREGKQYPEEEEEVPDLADLAQQQHAYQVENRRSQQHNAGTEAVAHPTGDGGVEGAESVIGRNAEGDQALVPAEGTALVGQRRQHDTGGHADGAGENLNRGQDGDDYPAIVEGEPSRQTPCFGWSDRGIGGGAPAQHIDSTCDEWAALLSENTMIALKPLRLNAKGRHLYRSGDYLSS